jgi:hypothetical protein
MRYSILVHAAIEKPRRRALGSCLAKSVCPAAAGLFLSDRYLFPLKFERDFCFSRHVKKCNVVRAFFRC